MPLNISVINDPTFPLLEANRATIESVERKTYAYGLTDTHQLDIYYPPLSLSSEADHKPPIVVFIHGGGFVQGSRSFSPQNLVHNNLGAFFALRGILAVVPDYRLVPGAVFPQASEDVRDSLLWIIENVNEGDSTRLFIIGHSAGGTHVASMMLDLCLFPPPLQEAVRGIVFMSTPFEIPSDKKLEFRKAAEEYYGVSKIATNQPIGSLRRADAQYAATLPPLQNLIAEKDSRMIKSSMRTFSELWKRKGGATDDYVLLGHNHFSPIFALGSGSGEDWGEYIVKWILGCMAEPCKETVGHCREDQAHVDV